MPVVHRYDMPERFVAGTVGPPGQRTFFLQAREGERITSVALEKQQVAVLAERIDALLDEVMRAEGGAGSVPAVTPAGLADTEPLDLPIEEEFRAGTMTLAWDPEENHVDNEVFALDDSDAATAAAEATAAAQDVPEDAVLEEELVAEEMLVVTLTAPAARAFCERAEVVVAAGRPPCQFCGQPMDPAGHLCPRAIGFRRR